MAYIQKATPPPNKVMTFLLNDFSGGLNNKSDQLEPNQARSLMNMRFVDDTLMENRYGQSYFDEVDLVESVVFIDEYKPYIDQNVLIRATQTKLYVNDLILSTISSAPCGVNHFGRYFIVDGVKLYVYGKFAQSTDTYTKVIGIPIDDYVFMEVVSPSVDHLRLDTTHTEGVLNIDYTLFKVFYEPCENEFVDTLSGANVVPIGIKYLVSHNGRLFTSGYGYDNDNVFITDVQNPFYFPVALPIQLPPNSDQVMGLSVFDNSVIVGRNDDLYAIFGSTNRPNMGVDVFQLRRINSHTGFANHNAVKVSHNYLFFLGGDGVVYSLSSAKLDNKVLSTTVISKTLDFTKEPLNLSTLDFSTATSIFFNDEWYLSIKDKVLVYSYLLQAWTVYGQMDAQSFYVSNHELIWGRSDGRTTTFNKTLYLDFGLPYQSYWSSMKFDMKDANSYKQFREFYLLAKTYEEYTSDVNIVFEIDYENVGGHVIINNQISYWGKSKWGDRLVTKNINESLPFTIGRRGRTISFTLSCGYFLDGSVDDVGDLESYLGKKDGLLVSVLSEEGVYYLFMDGQWQELTMADLNQRMKIYQISGDYELRGKR